MLTFVIVTGIVLTTHDRFSGSVLGMADDVWDPAERADRTGAVEIGTPTAAPSPTVSLTPVREFVDGEIEDESAVPLLRKASTTVHGSFESLWMRTETIFVDPETDHAWIREPSPVTPGISAESEGLPGDGETGSEH